MRIIRVKTKHSLQKVHQLMMMKKKNNGTERNEFCNSKFLLCFFCFFKRKRWDFCETLRNLHMHVYIVNCDKCYFCDL